MSVSSALYFPGTALFPASPATVQAGWPVPSPGPSWSSCASISRRSASRGADTAGRDTTFFPSCRRLPC